MHVSLCHTLSHFVSAGSQVWLSRVQWLWQAVFTLYTKRPPPLFLPATTTQHLMTCDMWVSVSSLPLYWPTINYVSVSATAQVSNKTEPAEVAACVFTVYSSGPLLFLPAPRTTDHPPPSCRHTQNAKHNTRPAFCLMISNIL